MLYWSTFFLNFASLSFARPPCTPWDDAEKSIFSIKDEFRGLPHQWIVHKMFLTMTRILPDVVAVTGDWLSGCFCSWLPFQSSPSFSVRLDDASEPFWGNNRSSSCSHTWTDQWFQHCLSNKWNCLIHFYSTKHKQNLQLRGKTCLIVKTYN